MISLFNKSPFNKQNSQQNSQQIPKQYQTQNPKQFQQQFPNQNFQKQPMTEFQMKLAKVKNIALWVILGILGIFFLVAILKAGWEALF